jgi:hypothetical protein
MSNEIPDRKTIDEAWESAKKRETEQANQSNSSSVEPLITEKKNTSNPLNKLLGFSIIGLGIISGILFFIGGFKLSANGAELTTLQSVSGNSIAEEYYQTMGSYGVAYSFICFAFGLGIIAVSIGLGGRMVLDNEESK